MTSFLALLADTDPICFESAADYVTAIQSAFNSPLTSEQTAEAEEQWHAVCDC